MPEMRQLGYTWINLESLKNVVGMYAKWDHTSYNLAVITSLGSGPVADEIVFKVYLDEDAEIVKFIEARARASKMITEIKMLGHIWINMDALKKAISMYAKDDGSMDESYDLAVITSLKPNPADTKFESSLLFNGFGPSEIVLEASILETEVDGFIEEWVIQVAQKHAPLQTNKPGYIYAKAD